MIYNNYHRHDDYSNVRVSDVVVKPEDYIKRTLELGHKNYFTTNHGCSANVFEAYDLCKQNGLKCIYGMEMYYTDDRFIKHKDSTTSHIIVIGLTKNAYYEINRISSLANTEGFYGKPRIDLELLLSLPKNEVIITTACIVGRLFKDDYLEKFVLPLKNYFGDNFMLEVQCHNHPSQAEWNKKVLQLHYEYNIPLIHANDSHYIYPEQAMDRIEFLKGKNMNYGDEDSFILDYPDSQTIIERYNKQGVLNDSEIYEALENTLIFDKAEDLKFTKEIKMPSAYKKLNIEQKHNKLQEIIKDRFTEKIKSGDVQKDKIQEYVKAINFEFDIIKETAEAQTVDYFLLNEKIVDLAVNKYNGVLTKTGRGSCCSFYINNLLGFSNIDRIFEDIPLYPTRFMSKSRILKSKSLPDIDYNTGSPTPFVQATKDILGQDNIYYMIAYGTMQESGAFRNLCRARNIPMEEYNEVGKNLEKYVNDPKWKQIIEDSKKYIGVIDSVSPSPCSFLILNEPISREIGLIKVGDEICCAIDGYTSDVWKFLKEDFLTVSVWKIISDTFNLIGKPIPTIKELRNLLDEKVWNLYRDGITATLNQVDSDWATGLMKRYAVQSPEEMCKFVSAIRPSFATLLDNFLSRKPYTTGVTGLDMLLESSDHYLLWQENIMEYLVWLGIEEDKTYDLIKKISKKTMTQEEIANLKGILKSNWMKKLGSEEGFEESWIVVELAVSYLFNSSHGLCVAYDSLYGAYLKANFPLEYYTIILNEYATDVEETSKIISELPYFNISLKSIQFRHSKDSYSFDKETNSIYKGVFSVKYMNDQIANELFELGKNQYDTFIDLLVDIKEKTSVNARQMSILIKLNFFKEFGNNKKLLDIYEYFTTSTNKYEKTYVEKTKIKRLIAIREHYNTLQNESLSLKLQLESELEYLGYIQTTFSQLNPQYYVVTNISYGYSNLVSLYCLNNGQTENLKVKSATFEKNPFNKLDIIKVIEKQEKNKFRYISEGKYEMLDSKEWILTKYALVK